MNGVTESLQSWVVDVFCRVGLRHDDAVDVAESLMFAERRGLASHGLMRIAIYLDRIRAGGIKKDGMAHIESERGALLVVNADAAPGAASARWCADLAVTTARQAGVSCVVAHNANHFGAAALFANRMADSGMVGIVCCNTDAIMSGPSGGRRVLGSNPLAISLPVNAATRPQLDMATTTTSLGKVLIAKQLGHPIPAGWAVDIDGKPTTDAGAAANGALLPFGGPKGFALAFMIDALVGLAGARTSTDVAPLYGDPSVPQGLGHLFLAIDASGSDQFPAHVEQILDTVTASQGPTGGPPGMFPGQPELISEHAYDGQLPPDLLAQLQEMSIRLGLPPPPAA